MKKTWKILLGSLLIAVVLSVAAAASAEGENGLHQDEDGIWRLYQNGSFASGYTGVYNDATYGAWLVRGGLIDWGFSGTYRDSNLGTCRISGAHLEEVLPAPVENGLHEDDDGVWRLYLNSKFATGYNGLYEDAKYGWWLIKNGIIDWSYNALYDDAKVGWWKIAGGTIDWGYNGLYCDPNWGWWLIKGGTINRDYNGLYEDSMVGWWKIKAGCIDWGYNGLYEDAKYGWWLIKNGEIDWKYNGLYNDANVGWWKIAGGTIDWGYSGLYWEEPYDWCMIDHGAFNGAYNGLYHFKQGNVDDWFVIKDGHIDWGYNGLYNDANVGWWKIAGGAIEWGYNGLYCDPQLGWVLITGGRINVEYSGLYWEEPYDWCMIDHGAFNGNYNGLYHFKQGNVDDWFVIKDGHIDWGYNGLYNDANVGWWKIAGGAIEWGYNGLYCDPQLGWWLITGGRINIEYSGLYWEAPYDWCMIDHGAFNGTYNGLYHFKQGDVDNWFVIKDGHIDWGYNGLYNDATVGWWKIAGGAIDWDFTGDWDDPNLGKVHVTGGHLDDVQPSPDPVPDPDPTPVDPTQPHLEEVDNNGWWVMQNGEVLYDVHGMFKDPIQGMVLIGKGKLAEDYSGMWDDTQYGSWVIKAGKADTTVNGLYTDPKDTYQMKWYAKNGQVDKNYNGLVAISETDLVMITKGAFNQYFIGVGATEDGKLWRVTDGKVDMTFTGMFCDGLEEGRMGWVYIRNGQVITDYTGIAYNDVGTGVHYFNNGKLEELHTGPAQDPDGTWRYLHNGLIDKVYAGLVEIVQGEPKVYYRNGTPDNSFTGVVWDKDGAWFVKNGVVDKAYTAAYKDGGISYDVKNGKATTVSAETPMLAVFFNSRADSSDTLYVSFNGVDFYSLGEAYKNAYPDIDGFEETDPDRINKADIATMSPSLNPDSEFSDMVIKTLRDPCIFYKDGVFWMLGGGVDPSTGLYAPILGYSTDLVNWSYPMKGREFDDNRSGLKPTVAPKDANGNRTERNQYDGVAADAFVDDDGTVWMTVTLGHYADNEKNQLSQYIVKASGLTAPADKSGLAGSDERAKVISSEFDVTYGDLKPINLPANSARGQHDWEFEYDGSLFKDNGKYYLAVQHSGREVELWTIDDLNKADDPSAWTLVNAEITEGSEGPSITKNNGKYYMYTDRFDGWDHNDDWGDYHGMFVFTGDSLDKTFTDHQRINTVDSQGNKTPARHGTIISLTDEQAKEIVLRRYNELYNK